MSPKHKKEKFDDLTLYLLEKSKKNNPSFLGRLLGLYSPSQFYIEFANLATKGKEKYRSTHV